MGLISKEVIMKWHSTNKKWYESKGYIYTKMGDEFEVKVEDLPNGSNVYIHVSCDCEDCTTPIIKPIKWQDYLKCVKKDEKYYYCNKCANKLFGVQKRNKIQLLKSQSFGYWLIKNLPLKQAVNIIARWDTEKNGCDIRDVGYGSSGFNKKGYWFKCLMHLEHGSELKSINAFTNGYKNNLDCTICSSVGQYILDTYGTNGLSDYWDYNKNDKLGLNPFEIPKGTNKVKVWIFCQEKDYHNSYDIIPNNFTSNTSRCPFCSGLKVHKYDSLGWLHPQVLDIWSEKNKKSPYEYMPMSNQYAWFKCKDGKHEDYYRAISNSNIYNFRCSECVNENEFSMLQQKVNNYLEILGYDVLHEHKCTIIPQNPKHKGSRGRMPFDNEIKINNTSCVIETMGEQHEKLCYLHKMQAKQHNTTPEYELYMQKVRDRYKRIYAKSKGYEYLAISYRDIQDNENYKKLIDDKINEILNKNKTGGD